MFNACCNSYLEKALLAVLVSRKLAVIFPPTLTRHLLSVASSSAGVVAVRYSGGGGASCCRPYSQFHHSHKKNWWKINNSNENDTSSQQHSRRSNYAEGSSSRGKTGDGRWRQEGRGDNHLSTAVTTGERGGRGRTGGRNNWAASPRIAGVNTRKHVNHAETQMEMSLKEYKREFRREIEEYGDPMDEPDPRLFSKTFDDHIRETERGKDLIKARRLTKKHYGDMDFNQKEINLLTWAEKENIRYLDETDPYQWTPEAIAEAFPISTQGVEKILRSTMKLRTARDVKNHDARVAEKIKSIQNGTIPMTEELERRIKIRELVPLRQGDLGMHPENFIDSSLPEKLGEFASLVAPPDRLQTTKMEDKRKGKSVGHYISEAGDDHKPPLEQELSPNQLKKMIPAGKLMTFSEFEHRMEDKKAGKRAGDMKYMLEDLKHISDTRPTSSKYDEELASEKQLDSQLPSNIQKYRKPEETGQPVEVNVEGERAYIYQAETGYQKPYGDGETAAGGNISPESIVIPEKLRKKPGATYKFGDSYYDEHGEFLYRVV